MAIRFSTNTQTNKDGTTRSYLQITESYYDKQKKQSRNRTLKTLGRIDDPKTRKKAEALGESLKRIYSDYNILTKLDALTKHCDLHSGALDIFSAIWHQLQLDSIIQETCPKGLKHYSPERAIFAMVLHRLVDPDSRRDCSRFVQTVYDSELADLQLHQLYRALDVLYPKIREVEQGLFWTRRELFNQEVLLALYDLTTCTVWGKGLDALFQYGAAKNKRTDKKQYKLGLLVDQTGFPIGHDVWRGNLADIKTLLPTLKKLRMDFGLSRIAFVLDRGFYGRKYFAALRKAEFDYICGVPLHKAPHLKDLFRTDQTPFKLVREVKDGLWVKTLGYDGETYHFVYSRDRAYRDQQVREHTLGKLRANHTGQSLKKLIKNPVARQYIQNSADTRVTIDEGKVLESAKWDGFFVLRTNLEDDAIVVVESYKSLWQIEHRFRDLKTNLEITPGYHWTKERITSYVCICFLALVVEFRFHQVLTEAGLVYEYKSLLKSICDIRTSILECEGNYFALRPHLDRETTFAYRAVKARSRPHIDPLESPLPDGWIKTPSFTD